MKKLSLLLMVMTIAFAASATMPVRGNVNAIIQPSHRVIGQKASLGAPVTAQPEGTMHVFTRAGGYMYYQSGIGVNDQSGSVIAIFADDGKTVWIKDIMAGAKTGAWVQAELSDDGQTLTLPLYQSIYAGTTNDGEPFEAYLAWGSTSIDTEEQLINFELDERTTEVTFTIDGNVLTMEGSEGVYPVNPSADESYIATGLTLVSKVESSDEYGWMGYMDWKTSFTDNGVFEMPEMITEQPEGELVTYKRFGNTMSLQQVWFWTFVTNGEQDGKINVVYAPDGKTVYIQNIMNGYEEYFNTWVKGELDENGLIHVPTGQCIYWSDEYMGGVMLTMGDIVATLNNEGFDVAEKTDEEIVLAIDDNFIYLLNTRADIVPGEEGNDTYTIHGLTGFWSDDNSNVGSIDWDSYFVHVDAVPAVPANPEDVEWNDGFNELGDSYLSFKINVVDVDGNYLDDDHLYYRIYTDDGQIFTFDPETYAESGITENMTDMPYNFTGWEISGKQGVVYFYRTNYNENPFFNERIGVQTVYIVDDVENVSDIVYWYRPVAVPAVPADPTADNWVDEGDESGFNEFQFTINMEDVDGNPLDPGYVYYSIYTDDDQIFTFDPETYSYSGVTEDMTMVPYVMQYYDLHPENGHVYFYRTNAEGYETFFNERIGIQVHYIVNGVQNSSNIVYWYLPEPEPVEPVTPANPVAIKWYDCGDESGDSYFEFQIVDRDVDGNPIDMENLSYSIFVDNDEIFTFYANEYVNDLTTDRTEIPYWLYSNAYDFMSDCVYFYRTNTGENPMFENRIGIQVYYRVNGQLAGQSDIVYLDLDTSVDEVSAGKTVANVRYYNVAGQEMAQPEGITIKVTTYTDGSTHATKVVK